MPRPPESATASCQLFCRYRCTEEPEEELRRSRLRTVGDVEVVFCSGTDAN